jgi:hypothetical protein
MDCISPSEESKLMIVYLLGCFYVVLLTVIKLSLATYYIDNKVIDLVCQIFLKLVCRIITRTNKSTPGKGIYICCLREVIFILIIFALCVGRY